MGVYDKTTKPCACCGKITPHHTAWESEQPDVLESTCQVCGRVVQSGPGLDYQIINPGCKPTEAKP